MAEPKLPSEHYENFGGRNRKSSAYVTGPREVYDILNLDYHLIGSLCRRPGSGPYITGTFPGVITGVYEYNKLSGASYLLVTSGTVSGAGTSQGFFNATGVTNGVPIRNGGYNASPFAFQTFVDYLFAANGQEIVKWNGTSFSLFSLPSGTIDGVFIGNSAAITRPGSGASGVYIYAFGYLNQRGYYGPAIDVAASDTSFGSPFNLGQTVNLIPTKYFEFDFINPVPVGYGITARVIYRSDANLSQLYRIATVPVGATAFIDGVTYTTALGTTYGLYPLQSDLAPETLFFTLVPRFMELYNNQMFYGGFSGLLSTYYYSDIGEPEGVGATTFEEVRTNDGDGLSAFKSYNAQMMIGKHKSLHSLRGDNPANFYLQEISTTYGILSAQAAVVFNTRFWFLDEQGIAEFDGADVHIVSPNMEDIFKRMNVAAAKNSALMLHAKQRNEVWAAIPIDGATLNNIIVFYDYIADAWGLYSGFNPNALRLLYGTNVSPTVFFGESNQIHTLRSDLFQDNGRSVTAMVQFRFETPQGNSTTKMFRRLWTDISPLAGVTFNLAANLYADHATLPALSTTYAQGIFQTRLEFGIPAKSLSVQIINSDNSPFNLNGYSLASRFLRDV